MTRTWNFVVTVGLCAGVAGGQTVPSGPSVSLDPKIECWSLDGHPSVQATVTPDAPIARLYFRCSLYPDYYFVDLEPRDGLYAAILPQAQASCPAVHYYVEAVGSDFASSRTRERVADVKEASECRRRFPLASIFEGRPSIILGATSALAPQMAPGFSLAGISGFLSAAGVASGAAGGAALGTSAIAAIGGVAAGGAALAVSQSGGEELPMETVVELGDVASEPPPATTTAATPPSVPPSGPGDTEPIACFDMDPNPAVVATGEPLRLDASCSRADSEGQSSDRIAQYAWDFSDGRQKTGRVVTIVFREAGNYDVTLTVTDGGTSARARSNQDSLTRQIVVENVVEERIEACFTAADADFGTG